MFSLLAVGLCAGIAALSLAWWSRRADETPRVETSPPVALQQGLPEPAATPPEPAATPPEPAATPPGSALPEPAATPPQPGPRPTEPAAAPSEWSFTPASQLTPADLKEEALQVATRLVKEFPDHSDAIGLMGMVYDRIGNSVEALDCWQRCLQLDPRRADVCNAIGFIALKKGEFGKAAALWRRALEIDPTMPGVHHRLARALIGLGKWEEAVAPLEEDIKITPGASRSYFLLGQAAMQLKDYQKAKRNYEATIELEPYDANAYYGLATACARLGQRDESRKHMKKFQELKNEYWKVHTDLRSRSDDLGQMRAAMAQTHTDAGRVYGSQGNARMAEELWRRAAALDPKNTACRRELASLYQSRGRERETLEIQEQLREIEPENALHHLNIGVAHARLRQFDAAEEAFQKARRLAPHSSTPYRALAQLHLRTGSKLPEAATLAERAVELEPLAPNYYILSEARRKNGDLAGALASIRRAIELEPDNAKYQRVYEMLQERK